MKILSRPSLNFDSRDDHAVDMLVLHYTGMETAEAALQRLCDPGSKVSCHYLIEEDGTVHWLVKEDKRAWHAGTACWHGHTNINQRSIGIELANPGHDFGYKHFPRAQIDSLIELIRDILTRHEIPARNIIGHSDVAPDRKEDPGEKFPWEKLARAGIGLWPADRLNPRWGDWVYGRRIRMADIGMAVRPVAKLLAAVEHKLGKYSPPPVDSIQCRLLAYGYDTPITGHWDKKTHVGVYAFQRHFRPRLLTGQWDNQCEQLLAALLSMV